MALGGILDLSPLLCYNIFVNTVQYRPLGLAINGMGTQLYAGPVPYFFARSEVFASFPSLRAYRKRGGDKQLQKGWYKQ